jgi:hypothetical protein
MAFFFGKKIRGMQSIIANGNLKKTNSYYPFGPPITEPLPMATSEVDMKFLSAFAVRLDPLQAFGAAAPESSLEIISPKFRDQLADLSNRPTSIKTIRSYPRTSTKS